MDQRNLVLCCDGTSNQFSKDRTSVIKLFHALIKDDTRQLVYYHPGIGTRAPTGIGTKTGGWVARTAGLAFGYKLQDDVTDAIAFLMDNYRDGDRLYVFGFSRGAYTARVICAMLHLYGLPMAGNDPLVPYATQMLWALARAGSAANYQACRQLAQDFKGTISSRECKTHFLGVWDTVNSVGWIGSPLTMPYARDNPDVAIVRHAKAIDERRGFFRVNWFKEDPARDIREVWFPGTHCDVGGGFPEAESGLSKYPLEWMARKRSRPACLSTQIGWTRSWGKRAGPMPRPHPWRRSITACRPGGGRPSSSPRSIGTLQRRNGNGVRTCSATGPIRRCRSCMTSPGLSRTTSSRPARSNCPQAGHNLALVVRAAGQRHSNRLAVTASGIGAIDRGWRERSAI